ncbi:MAG: PfkB family carbohydrate kinase [Planctomycetota bacterium]
MSELLVVGSIAFDTIETPHGRAERVLGGSANYFSLAASLLTKINLVGVVGQDFPEAHLDFLRARGISCDGVERREGETFNWTGRYEGDMNEAQTLEVNLNVFGNYLPTIPESYRKSPYVFLANGSPDTQKHVLGQLDSPKFVMADTMNLWISTQHASLLDLLKRVDALILNDGEAKMLTDESSTVVAGKRILDLGPMLVIIKKGEHGAVILARDYELVCPAYPLETVKDPTGAGDSFAGGVMGYLSFVDDISIRSQKRALKYGTVMSSYNCEDFSISRLKTLSRADVERRLAEFQDMLI